VAADVEPVAELSDGVKVAADDRPSNRPSCARGIRVPVDVCPHRDHGDSGDEGRDHEAPSSRGEAEAAMVGREAHDLVVLH
jgi:hypothetical protein